MSSQTYKPENKRIHISMMSKDTVTQFWEIPRPVAFYDAVFILVSKN